MERIKSRFAVLSMFCVSVSCAFAAAGVFTLSDAENSAVNSSGRLKAAFSERDSYEERAAAQKTLLYPRLTLDGSYRYVTTVPEIALSAPGGSVTKKLGDNNNYSVGPMLSWTLLDFGSSKNASRSYASAAAAKKYEAEAVKRQVVFAARSAYFGVALAAEQLMLYADAVKVAVAQYEDIKINARAGTKSPADELKAHQELISKKKLLIQARADLAAAMSDLSAATGRDVEGAEFERIDSMLKKFRPFLKSRINENHPVLEAYAKSAEASEYSALASGSLMWPKIQVYAKSSLDYPNGPELESFNQNAAGASLIMPLYEFGASAKRVKESEAASRAALMRGEQALSDMKRDWAKTKEQLSNLEEQDKLNGVSVSETGKLAGMVFSAYKTGSVSYIEVENANLKALEAKIQSARTKVQMLMNLAVLAGMAE